MFSHTLIFLTFSNDRLLKEKIDTFRGSFAEISTYLHNEGFIAKTWRNSYLTHKVGTRDEIFYTMVDTLKTLLT